MLAQKSSISCVSLIPLIIDLTILRRLIIIGMVLIVNSNRKPLIIQGARQVGKTWAMKYFGE